MGGDGKVDGMLAYEAFGSEVLFWLIVVGAVVWTAVGIRSLVR